MKRYEIRQRLMEYGAATLVCVIGWACAGWFMFEVLR